MGVDVRGMAPLLEVFDMPTSVAFYRDLLGFEWSPARRHKALGTLPGDCSGITASS